MSAGFDPLGYLHFFGRVHCRSPIHSDPRFWTVCRAQDGHAGNTGRVQAHFDAILRHRSSGNDSCSLVAVCTHLQPLGSRCALGKNERARFRCRKRPASAVGLDPRQQRHSKHVVDHPSMERHGSHKGCAGPRPCFDLRSSRPPAGTFGLCGARDVDPCLGSIGCRERSVTEGEKCDDSGNSACRQQAHCQANSALHVQGVHGGDRLPATRIDPRSLMVSYDSRCPELVTTPSTLFSHVICPSTV